VMPHHISRGIILALAQLNRCVYEGTATCPFATLMRCDPVEDR
jgi:hypothetical protein